MPTKHLLLLLLKDCYIIKIIFLLLLDDYHCIIKALRFSAKLKIVSQNVNIKASFCLSKMGTPMSKEKN